MVVGRVSASFLAVKVYFDKAGQEVQFVLGFPANWFLGQSKAHESTESRNPF